tara:strand:+ start:12196 stop:14094 length:1899 start_codon:yes stop_codon:yes gene_type:complete
LISGIGLQKKYWKKLDSNIYKIGVIVEYSAIANQLIQYIEDLNEYSSVDSIGIIVDDENNIHRQWFEKHYPEVPFLFCRRDECKEIDLLDVIVIPESNKSIYEYIPSKITRIGLPHGTDVPIESTLCVYGGGFYFDYVLGARKQPKLTTQKYINSFPAVMRLHQQPFVSELPFGFPKLDKFFNAVSKLTGPKKAIIYHLSLLSVEEYWVVDVIFETLKTLLDEFPDKTIIFRVHHFNNKHPKVIECLNLGRGYSNFYYSDADSYIDDYARGAVMVTHREYYNHLFDLATGCPTIVYKLDPSYSLQYGHDGRYFTTDKIHFIDVLNQALNSRFDTSEGCRKKRCLAAGIYNPGASFDYLVDNIEHIVSGQVLPEWTTYFLNEGTSKDVDFKLRQLIVSNRPFGPFAMAFGVMANHSALSLLLLAENYIRNSNVREYYYPLGFTAFYKLVHHEDFDLLSVESKVWWKIRGEVAFEFCCDAIDNGEISVTHELMWLRDHYQVSIESVEEINDVVRNDLKIINFYDGSNVQCGDILFYGAGAFTESIILSNQCNRNFNPIAIFDGDELKQNSLFMGIPVFHPDKIEYFSQDIIIGSQGSVTEIVNSLIINKNVKNKLFGFVNDPINNFLLNLLAKN